MPVGRIRVRRSEGYVPRTYRSVRSPRIAKSALHVIEPRAANLPPQRGRFLARAGEHSTRPRAGRAMRSNAVRLPSSTLRPCNARQSSFAPCAWTTNSGGSTSAGLGSARALQDYLRSLRPYYLYPSVIQVRGRRILRIHVNCVLGGSPSTHTPRLDNLEKSPIWEMC
jgi:hypothetical protein